MNQNLLHNRCTCLCPSARKECRNKQHRLHDIQGVTQPSQGPHSSSGRDNLEDYFMSLAEDQIKDFYNSTFEDYITSSYAWAPLITQNQVKLQYSNLTKTFVVFDILYGAYENINYNQSPLKIMSDAFVDLAIGTGTYFATTKVTTVVGTALCPGAGTAAGFVVGLAIALPLDIIVYGNGMTGRESIKNFLAS